MPTNITTSIHRLCYLSFQYLVPLEEDILQCLLYLSFFIHFKQQLNAGGSVTLIICDSWAFVSWGSNNKTKIKQGEIKRKLSLLRTYFTVCGIQIILPTWGWLSGSCLSDSYCRILIFENWMTLGYNSTLINLSTLSTWNQDARETSSSSTALLEFNQVCWCGFLEVFIGFCIKKKKEKKVF